MTAVRWADIERGCWQEPRRARWLQVIVPVLCAAAVAFAPLPAIALGLGVVLFAAIWRDPRAVVYVLIALMGNVKINFYTGFFTVFPDYLPIALGSIAWALRWMEGEREIEEQGLILLFLGFFLAGCLSCVEAINVARVFSKSVLILIALAIFYLTMTSIRRPRDVMRALAWVEGAAFVVGGYGVVQMVGGLLGWPVDLTFLEKYGNPEFQYSVGTPVLYQFTKFFRANSLFNDSNIFAGYLAACLPIVLALLLYHAETGRKARVRTEVGLLLVLVLSLLLSLSRSGFLATFVALAFVLACKPAILRRAAFWAWGGLGLAGASAVAASVGLSPMLLLVRLGMSFDQQRDVSTRTHAGVAAYAITLFRRSPLTGVGLRNFGVHYAGEIDPHYPNMMAHNALLSYLAEAGLFGVLTFAGVACAIAWRPARALRDPCLVRTDPALHAAIVGLMGAVIALGITNIFYDFSLRTFVWTIAGLAVAAARAWETYGTGDERA